jgi:hypothetical protein
MLARALHLHRVFSFGVHRRVAVTAAALALCPCCLPVLCFAALHLHFDAVVGSVLLDSIVLRFVCVSQAPCWEGESPRRDTASGWPVVACIACVVPVVHCIRLIPAAMHVCTVAQVVLTAEELSRAVVLCLVLYSCSPTLQVASDLRRKAAELSNARVCKQLHCNRVLVEGHRQSQAPRKVCRPRSGACCLNQK